MRKLGRKETRFAWRSHKGQIFMTQALLPRFLECRNNSYRFPLSKPCALAPKEEDLDLSLILFKYLEAAWRKLSWKHYIFVPELPKLDVIKINGFVKNSSFPLRSGIARLASEAFYAANALAAFYEIINHAD
jgi:hypothetical protein